MLAPDKIKLFRDLIVWQKSMKLAAKIYSLTRKMPKQEEYRLTSQMLRAAASVPANIAEGHMRGSRRDYARFIHIARGSLAELETFVILASDEEDVRLLARKDTEQVLGLLDEVGRMLNSLSHRLAAVTPATAPLKPNP